MTITEFLLARIAEDEAVAQAAAWVPDPDEPDDDYDNPWAKDHGEFASRGGARFTHILRNDPARVLAECAAKRAIVESERLLTADDNWEIHCMSDLQWGNYEAWERTVKQLAAVYKDHPDYDETWKP